VKPVLHVDSRFLSPYAMSAYVALVEKNLPFDLRTVDLASGAQHEPGYAGRSITRRVPMLEHGTFALAESSAIAEYLEDVYPPPAHAALYPAKPEDRARARQVQAWLRSDLLALRAERSTEVVYLGPVDKPLSEEAQRAAQRLIAAAQALIGSKGRLFAAWCIADTDLALMLNRLVRNGDEVPSALAEFARREWERPSVRAWLEKVAAA
jgi:glutathione S-transferase